MITRAEDGTISDRGNAALLLGGGGAFAVSGLLLVVKGRELPRDILVLLITLAGLGATAVALVDLAGLRDAGLFLPIPFAVPIVLGLIRLFRRP
jgi:hypothetical protein